MAAVLSLSIFFVLFAVGLAVLLLLKRGPLSVGEALIAPAFGIAAFVIPTVLLSQLGLPIERFAIAEFLALICAALGVIFWRRGAVPWQLLLIFVPLVAFAFVLIAWPQCIYGFNWVSFSNDDMTNYALAADRLVTHGFYQLPPMRPDEIFRGYNADYWLMYVANGERTGVEMLLAIVAATTHLRGFQAFMPSIIAFHLTLICATTALGWGFRHRSTDALVVGALMGVSPLTSLGTFYQLLAQVCGLSLLVAQVSLLSNVASKIATSPERSIRSGAALGVLLTAQILIYPELLPFAVLTYAIWAALAITNRTLAVKHGVIIGAAAAAAVLVFARGNLFRMLTLLASRVLGQAAPHIHTVGPLHQAWYPFPYFLVPSGFSSLWGITMLNNYGGTLLSVGIALGILLTGATAAFAIYRAVRSADAAAILLCIMLGLGVVLFVKRVDFGLFKLAMYIQPALIATFAFFVVTPSKFRASARMGFLLLFASGILTQWRYAQTSVNGPFGSPSGFVQVRNATPLYLLNDLANISRQREHFDAYISDTSNYVLGKYETGYVGSKPLFFITDDFRTNIRAVRKPEIPAFRPAFPKYDSYSKALLRGEAEFFRHASFVFPGGHVAKFSLPHLGDRYGDVALFHDGGADVVLNRFNARYRKKIVYLAGARTIRNDLAFVQSSLGFAPGPAPVSKISLFQVEPDFFRPGRTMSGIGRYLLFTILNPTPGDRMLISLTDTLSENGDDRLPPASVLGSRRVFFPLVGDGSARVVSPPLSTKIIGGYRVVGLDMGAKGHLFETTRTGLMNLFGTHIQIDPRLLTAFARNISVISASQYQAMKAPHYIKNLAAGLIDHNLLYSGIYEDGWISQNAYLRLSSGNAAAFLKINGLVPFIRTSSFREMLSCSIDGKIVSHIRLKIGYFHLKIPIHIVAGNHRVQLSFSSFERLPGGDGRPVSAKITSIGFR
ncbi:MAG: hypothetical protein ACP5O6_01675 [Candidatus Baltobacteraceae bacterium]